MRGESIEEERRGWRTRGCEAGSVWQSLRRERKWVGEERGEGREAQGEKVAKIDVVGQVEIKDGWMRWDRGSRPLG